MYQVKPFGDAGRCGPPETRTAGDADPLRDRDGNGDGDGDADDADDADPPTAGDGDALFAVGGVQRAHNTVQPLSRSATSACATRRWPSAAASSPGFQRANAPV